MHAPPVYRKQFRFKIHISVNKHTHTFVCPCAISSHAETLALDATVKKAGFENKLRRLQNAFGAFTKFEFRLTSEIEKMTENAFNTTPDSQTCPSLNANQRCFLWLFNDSFANYFGGDAPSG